jgi:hypothetical protein
MAQETGLIYNISPNGSAGDWYWDVRCDGSIIARGLAPTRTQARADAITSSAGRRDEPREDRPLPLESPSKGRPEDYDAPFIDDRDEAPNEAERQPVA